MSKIRNIKKVSFIGRVEVGGWWLDSDKYDQLVRGFEYKRNPNGIGWDAIEFFELRSSNKKTEPKRIEKHRFLEILVENWTHNAIFEEEFE